MKKFIISSEALKPAMKKLGQAINTKTILPVLRNIYCKVTSATVELITSDQELTISYSCPAETSPGEHFELLIPYDYLNNILGISGWAPVTIEHPSTRKARILIDKDIYELNSLDKIEDFPVIPSVPKKNSIKLDKDFVGHLSKAMHTCRKEEQPNPSLMRACLDIRKDAISLVSTDIQVLYKRDFPAQSTEPDQLLFTPALTRALEGIGELEVFWSKKQVAFKSEKVTVWSIRYEDKYPDYQKIIPTYEPNLLLPQDSLIHELRKACLSSDKSKLTTISLATKGDVKFETEDPENDRKIHGSIAADYSGSVDTLRVNAKKMLTMMEQVDVDNIRLHIEKQDRAVVVSTEEDPAYLGLIIPLKN